MGFWQGMWRMAKGEPVFQQTDDPVAATHAGAGQEPDILDTPHVVGGDTTQTPTAAPAKPTHIDQYHEGGHKLIPNVECERTEWHEKGDHRELWVTIKNHASYRVFVDRFVAFGQTATLSHYLDASHEREFCVYRGSRLASRSYTKATLYFRLPNGDYFCADHEVIYHGLSDGENEVADLKIIHPIRDV